MKNKQDFPLRFPARYQSLSPSEIADLSGGTELSWWDFFDALFGGFYISINIGWSGAKLAKITDVLMPTLSNVVKEIRVYYNIKLWGY